MEEYERGGKLTRNREPAERPSDMKPGERRSKWTEPLAELGLIVLLAPFMYYLHKQGFFGEQATSYTALIIVLLFSRAIKALWEAMSSK